MFLFLTISDGVSSLLIITSYETLTRPWAKILSCVQHTNAALQFEVIAELVSSGRSCTLGLWFVAIHTGTTLQNHLPGCCLMHLKAGSLFPETETFKFLATSGVLMVFIHLGRSVSYSLCFPQLISKPRCNMCRDLGRVSILSDNI